MLMVAAGKDEFATGFSKNGTTKEHALLAFTLGIRQMIVCVNKMDMIEYNQERFDEIQKEVTYNLNKIGFQTKNITFIPISGFKGENLIEMSENMKWYTG